ncbi:MAG: TonB-dependent receptor [Bryobacterales bacterium]|nr:TonB-dependent receptor [Bryobacterales bacterium]
MKLRLACLLLLGAAQAVLGQSNLATVTGVITDSTEAAVASVAVVVRNVDTNIERRVATDGTGNFSVVNLAPGNYELTAEAAGFHKASQKGIVLQVGQVLRTDIKLEVGAVSETVNVESSMVTINTENGTIKGDVIVQAEIQELPLSGRDFMDLAFFTPGVVPKVEGGQGSALNVNGARASNSNFYVDGFDNRNARGAAAQARPNIDALQEFKMEVSGYSAEFGRQAGGVMNMVLRSGTNQIHGNLNYFIRNDVFDARSFFETNKTVLRQNQFAATMAGPIVRNRTFFMVSFEGFRAKQEAARLSRVPTVLERDGDYSQSVNLNGGTLYLFDRLATGACTASNRAACFAGNAIPKSRMDAAGVKLTNTFPLPNRAAGVTGFNFFAVAADKDAWNSPLFKVDHKMGMHNLAFRAQFRNADTQNPFTGSDTGLFGTYTDDNRSLAGVDYTHMFRANFLAEFRFGVSRSATWDRGRFGGNDIATQLGLPNLIPGGESRNTPDLLDWPQIFTGNNYPDLGPGNNMPVQYFVTDWQNSAKFTYIEGAHSIRFGGNTNFVQMNQPYFNNQRGTFRFVGNRSGHSIADMQLGWLNNVTRQVGFNRNYWRQPYYGAFVNDDWKATRKLTLNLGLRWEVNRAPFDKYDRLGSYDTNTLKLVIASDANAPANYQALLDQTGLRGSVVTAQSIGRGRSVIATDWLNFSPRVGFAYRAMEKTVVRGGYGIFLSGDILNNLRNNLSNQFPFAINQNFIGVNATPELVSLRTPFPAERETITGTTTVNGFTMNPQQSYLQSWNITVERELFGGNAVEMDYRGSKGTHLQRLYDFNQPFRTLDSLIAGEGFQRPYPLFNTINIFHTGSNSIYNAFNVSWRRRSRSGLFWRVNYSLSKSIDDASQANGQSNGGFAGALDARNLRLDRARSDWDRRHVFTMVGSANLPFGKGRRWGASWHRAVDSALGGWQFSGTGTAYSGAPFTVEPTTTNLDQGGSARPNRIANGAVRENAALGKKGIDYAWYDVRAFEAAPCYVAAGVAPPAGCGPSAYGFQPFAFGNSGRNILDGPGLFSTDLAMAKNFTIREGHNLQLRVEAFNLLNRANFVVTDAMTRFDGLTGGLLSQVGGSGRGGGPRVFQYALKYRF